MSNFFTYILNVLKRVFNNEDGTTPEVKWNGKYLLLSAGHGGIHPETGRYTTDPEAHGAGTERPGIKCYRHNDGNEYHGNGWIYEGVLNRLYAEEIKAQGEKAGYRVVNIHDDYIDTPLIERVRRANQFPPEHSLHLPIHFNASEKQQGQGFEAYTTRGQNNSDKYAEILYGKIIARVKRIWSDYKIRTDPTDGDFDREKDFYEILHTRHANTYIEVAFFDNLKDLKRSLDKEFMQQFCSQVISSADVYFKLK